jgi:hypothetical protein
VFKQGMAAAGRFYEVRESLAATPALAGALLKYKTHEWAVFAFAPGALVERLWLNKGQDRASVTPILAPARVAEVARQGGYDSVLLFHNHPNGDPRHFDCTRPSAQDLASARLLADALAPLGVNLAEFVCERGQAYRYHLSVADSFLPEGAFAAGVRAGNGRSRRGNLGLHWERLSGLGTPAPLPTA